MADAAKPILLGFPLSDDELEYVRELNRTADERTIADGGIPVSPGWMPRMIATVDHLTAQREMLADELRKTETMIRKMTAEPEAIPLDQDEAYRLRRIVRGE